MSADSNISQQPWIQRNVLWLAGTFFLGSLALYFISFNGPLSDKQATWGEFGDYMGGVVNPIVGLCTVWLLTVSLRQNQQALKQAQSELEIAGKALKATEASQIASEAALKEQILLAQRSLDTHTVLALWSGLTTEVDHLRDRIAKETPSHWTGSPENSPTYQLRIQLKNLMEQRRLLDEFKDREIKRLTTP